MTLLELTVSRLRRIEHAELRSNSFNHPGHRSSRHRLVLRLGGPRARVRGSERRLAVVPRGTSPECTVSRRGA
jgi:hypothetical protein